MALPLTGGTLPGSAGDVEERAGTGSPWPPPVEEDRASILIVDDRPDKLLALQTILEELGQNIVSAQSGEEALKRVLEHDFAVILLDVNMPDMDGLETAAFIRKRQKTAHTPIIFVTAYADEMHTAQGYSLGAVDYILAPIIPDILRTKVKVFVQLHRMTHQIQRQATERVALAHEQAARTAAEESNRRYSFMGRLRDLMDQSLDVRTRGQELARFVVPFLGDLCTLVLVDERGHPRQTEIAWLDPTRPSELRSMSTESILSVSYAGAIERMLRSGRTEVAERLDELGPTISTANRGGAERAVLDLGFAPQRLVGFPLRARGRTHGVLLLGFGPGRRLDSTDFSFGNDVAGRVAILLDNAMLYEQVCEADSRKNEFLAMLGHELRNPMAPIRHAVHVLRSPNSDDSKRAWGLDVIDRQVKQLARLVDDLLDVSRITRGKIELKLESIDLAGVVSAAVETCRPLIESLRHELRLRLPQGAVRVRGDFARLTQVLANLLNNAAKYTEAGGRISVALERRGDEAAFRVRDSGIGILPEDIDKIFELFAQVDRKIDRAQGGLGIGLTLVERLVNLHGGSVECASAGPGHGAEFIVRLPALPVAEVADFPAPAPEHPQQATGVRVLVVDDNNDSADMMATSLQMDGHETAVAYDGKTAIDRARLFRPDVVLLDIGLPGMNGFEVARRLRSLPETRDSLLIALSGYGQADDRRRSLQAGLDHHLTKPVDPNALGPLFNALQATRQRQ